jgi:hypothetical protein
MSDIISKASELGTKHAKFLKKGLDILSFSRLTGRQVFEGEGVVSLKPRTKVFLDVLRKGHLYSYEVGENVLLNSFKDTIFNNSWNVGGTAHTFATLFFTANSTQTSCRGWVGTGTTAAASTQTGLVSPLYMAQGANTVGNAIAMDPATGNLTYTIKLNPFTVTLPATLTEASYGYYQGSGNTFGGTQQNIISYGNGASQQGTVINRSLFNTPVSVIAGDIVTLSFAFTFPTLAVTQQTVTLTAQNGMNLSGSLGLVGTASNIAGGSVSVAGAVSADTGYTNPLLPDSTGNQPAVFGLTTATAFPAYNANTTGMNTNTTATVWGTYTNGTGIRTVTGTWAIGTPASNTNFNSITLTKNGVNGYQLLLSSQQTKLTTYSLAYSQTFSLA